MWLRATTFAALLGALAIAAPANAGLTLSPLILDLSGEQSARGDVELFNNGTERLYVVVEPAAIADAGLATEKRVTNPDPEMLGLLATPNRVVLEPGARKFVRISMLKSPAESDRIFRVVVKPVVGAASGEATGLKVIVGYEMLVIQRPNSPHAALTAERQGDHITITNSGNTNAEIFRGKACPATGAPCEDLQSHRLYAGASVDVPLKAGYRAEYALKVQDKLETFVFTK